MSKIKCESIIIKLCTRLNAARIAGLQDIHVLQGLIEAKLAEITKKLSDVTCDFYGLESFWDQDFVLQLMDRPDIAWKICRNYQRMIVNLAAK